jgi:hypothetical protein
LITRSFDIETARNAAESVPSTEGMDWEAWLGDTRNVMFTIDNGDVGLATFEYPGLYNVHWFFNNTKGRAAINLAEEMLNELFTVHGAEAIRGFTPVEVKTARFLAKYVGLTSYGFVDTENGLCELMIMTKDEFYQHLKDKKNGS